MIVNHPCSARIMTAYLDTRLHTHAGWRDLLAKCKRTRSVRYFVLSVAAAA
jgi:hypothetical protein